MVRFTNSGRCSCGKLLKTLGFVKWHCSCIVKSSQFFLMEFLMSATNDTTALPLRTHTLLGVCEAVGEDFGFNPLFLRVPFSMAVLFSPAIAVGAYLVLGLIVAASRLIFPNPKNVEAPAQAAAVADNSSDEVRLAA